MEVAPSAVDRSKLAVVDASQAASLFIRYCYNSSDGAEVSKASEFTRNLDYSDVLLATHNNLQVEFQTLSAGKCFMTFVGDDLRHKVKAPAAEIIAKTLDAEAEHPDYGVVDAMVTDKGKIYVDSAPFVWSGGSGSRDPREFYLLFIPST